MGKTASHRAIKILSIMVPFYNEEKTVRKVLTKLVNLKIPGWKKEIIAVDDGSSDSSKFKVQSSRQRRGSSETAKFENIKFLEHKKNLGKGAAIQTALKDAKGDFMIVQDSDLEYNPEDIVKLVKQMEKTNSQIVMGSRRKFLSGNKILLYTWGINFSTKLVNFLFNAKLSDVYTCYKLFNLKLIREANVKSNGFEWDLEALVKLLKKGYKHSEVDISYNPRNFSEGKKIRPWHGVIGLWVIIKHRLL